MRSMRRLEDRRRAALSLILAAAMAAPLPAAPAPADLRLQWAGEAAAIRRPVKGTAGTTVALPYEIVNVGGSDAFAVVVTSRTTVGPVGTPTRIQPGPQPGKAIGRKVSFALVRGMREICVDASLQHRAGGEPPDPDVANNRICRAIEVTPQQARSEEDRR